MKSLHDKLGYGLFNACIWYSETVTAVVFCTGGRRAQDRPVSRGGVWEGVKETFMTASAFPTQTSGQGKLGAGS